MTETHMFHQPCGASFGNGTPTQMEIANQLQSAPEVVHPAPQKISATTHRTYLNLVIAIPLALMVFRHMHAEGYIDMKQLSPNKIMSMLGLGSGGQLRQGEQAADKRAGGNAAEELKTMMKHMGVRVYGNKQCPWSNKQLQELDITTEHELFVDCDKHPDEARDVAAFPSWRINGQIKPGFMKHDQAKDILSSVLYQSYNNMLKLGEKPPVNPTASAGGAAAPETTDSESTSESAAAPVIIADVPIIVDVEDDDEDGEIDAAEPPTPKPKPSPKKKKRKSKRLVKKNEIVLSPPKNDGDLISDDLAALAEGVEEHINDEPAEDHIAETEEEGDSKTKSD